jgi:hypothetical protein
VSARLLERQPAVRARTCPLCCTPAGEPCQPKPVGDHLARYLDSFTAGHLTRQYMAVVLGELVVVDTCVVIEWGEPGVGDWTGEVSRCVVRKDEPAAAELNGPDGFTCDYGGRLPWPPKTEDVTCPSCGAVWEHDGVTIGGGARLVKLGDLEIAREAAHIAPAAPPLCQARHSETGLQCARVFPPHNGYPHIAGDGSEWGEQ